MVADVGNGHRIMFAKDINFVDDVLSIFARLIGQKGPYFLALDEFVLVCVWPNQPNLGYLYLQK